MRSTDGEEILHIKKKDFRKLIYLVKKRIRIETTFKYAIEQFIRNSIEDDYNNKIWRTINYIKDEYDIKDV